MAILPLITTPSVMIEKFNERFGIEVDFEEAIRRFVNRVYNLVFNELYEDMSRGWQRDHIRLEVISVLGGRENPQRPLWSYVGDDFLRCLQALEGFYRGANNNIKDSLSQLIERFLSESEVDLGIRWEEGKFYKSGAVLLDEELVNEPLRWLSQPGYEGVLEPFAKGLRHFLETHRRPELLADVVTDMYEALEAMAKTVTGRDKDLSANSELFIKQVKASEDYKTILKQYVAYANKFRHAAGSQVQKPSLSESEVESFVYLTGVFLRLALE